jgi:L-ornithine N5-oxygenase
VTGVAIKRLSCWHWCRTNLAFAVAVEELAPTDLAGNTLLIEQQKRGPARGMLLPWTRVRCPSSRLVTLRNPRASSRSSTICVGRLNDFAHGQPCHSG